MANLYAEAMKQNRILKEGLLAADRELARCQQARDFLREQSNSMKGLVLALLRKMKADRAARDAKFGPDAVAETYAEPIVLTKAEATVPPEAAQGKGLVVLVEPQPDGSFVINIGDVDQPEENPTPFPAPTVSPAEA